MTKKYYVVGLFDTRGEIDIKGVTTSEEKARKWVAEKQRTKPTGMRQWYSFRETSGV